MYDEIICRHALNKIFGYTPKTARILIEYFGCASEIYETGWKRLKNELPYVKGIESVCDREYEKAAAELEAVESTGARFICDNDRYYPALLGECEDRPIGLYVRSDSPDEEIFDDSIAIAVIGTRDISNYGTEWCRKLVYSLAETGEKVVIVSGLAIGTDITAHRAALEKGIRTIAVIPTGIDRIYPSRHYRDAAKIVSAGGCALITDYPPGTPALKINFIRRNRIIAGMSKATLLIESKARGGGMITARLAFGYNRDVFALPGRADDMKSSGCNLLVKEKIAEPVISAESFIESLNLRRHHKIGKDIESVPERLNRIYSGNLGNDDIGLMSNIILLIKRNRDITIEEIAAKTGISYSKTAELTGLLECEDIISVDLMQRCNISS